MLKDLVSRSVRVALAGVGAILVEKGIASPEQVEAIISPTVQVAAGIAGIASALVLSYLSDKFRAKL